MTYKWAPTTTDDQIQKRYIENGIFKNKIFEKLFCQIF